MQRLLPKLPAFLRLGLLPRLLLALTLVGVVPLWVIQADRGRVEGALRQQVLRMHALAARSTAERVEALLETE
ncbi:MAG: hypothetical protein KDD11_21620, partial [Acidobacteria bacterium]|nr:hypothetical protein [Acidobacteriota bacterium]